MIKWIRTSRLSMKNSLPGSITPLHNLFKQHRTGIQAKPDTSSAAFANTDQFATPTSDTAASTSRKSALSPRPPRPTATTSRFPPPASRELGTSSKSRSWLQAQIFRSPCPLGSGPKPYALRVEPTRLRVPCFELGVEPFSPISGSSSSIHQNGKGRLAPTLRVGGSATFLESSSIFGARLV